MFELENIKNRTITNSTRKNSLIFFVRICFPSTTSRPFMNKYHHHNRGDYSLRYYENELLSVLVAPSTPKLGAGMHNGYFSMLKRHSTSSSYCTWKVTVRITYPKNKLLGYYYL